jgi:carbon monoxide dehydrogenase subunit G
MRFEGTLEAPVSPKKFYAFATAPDKIISILPDVEESKVTDGEHFFVKSKVGMSHIRGSVSMRFHVTEKRQDSYVKMVGRGQGIQSSIDLSMELSLENHDGGTRAKWVAETKVGGLLASVGSRLVNGVAERYIKQMTEALRQKVSE